MIRLISRLAVLSLIATMPIGVAFTIEADGVEPAAAASDSVGGVSGECVAADSALVAKLDPIRARQGIGAALPLGDVLAALSRARALCRAGKPERGLLVYIRISDAVANALAVRPLSANR